jgi:MSHA biogenesis protein MshQ
MRRARPGLKLFMTMTMTTTLLLAIPAARADTAPPYALTDAACVDGLAFGAAGQGCKEMSGAALPAGAGLKLYITALAGGVPTALSKSQDTTVAMKFALSCHNPASNAGVSASFAGVAMPLCTPNAGVPTAWSASVNLVFAKGAPSTGATLVYADVGKVQLFVRDVANRVVGAAPFVSKPDSLAIVSVTRSADGFVNPQAATGAGAGFAKVGEAFTMRAAALTVGGVVAPNFGNEIAGVRLALERQPVADAGANAAMVNPLVLAGDFASVVGGVFTGTAFSVDEAGIFAIRPRMTGADYLGAAVPAAVATYVGRFYPDHFDTVVVGTLQCLPHMGCASGFPDAAYSGQAFGVTVAPRNGAGLPVRNYNGVLARPITLSAWYQPGGVAPNPAGGAAANPAGGALSANIIAAASIVADAAIGAKPVYSLPHAFSNSAPRFRNWTAPVAIYLRASAEEDAAGAARLSSRRANAGASVEGGLVIVSGRLALDSPSGSEVMRMPVRAEAQYWANTGRWETGATDNISTLQSGGIAFANCRARLNPCDTAVLKVTAAAGLSLKSGVATFWLNAPGAGKVGSAEFQMNNPAWLPSAIGRAVFGVYNSPLIYRREVY